MAILALIVIGAGMYGLVKLPTGFLPLEDQGYLLLGVQLPDGASLMRTQQVMDKVGQLASKTPGVADVISIAGVSVLDNSAPLSNGGVSYVVLKNWDERTTPEESLRGIYDHLSAALRTVPEAMSFVLVPPSIQGIGNSGGFTMQLELRDGSFDFDKLQAMTRTVIGNGRTQSSLARLATSFRADVPQFDVEVDRVKAETLHVAVGDVFSAISTYLGSSYINQFNKFGRTYQVYAQAESKFRVRQEDIRRLSVRNRDGTMISLGTLVRVSPSVGPSIVSLYNLYPTATVIGGSARGFSSGQALDLMEQVATRSLPPGAGFEWTAMSYQEKAVGSQLLYAFGLGILLVYLVLAGQYESWLAPISVILAVPLALLGPVITLSALGIDNNLYTQIGLILLIALSAKNAILIVEVARERRVHDRVPLLEAAVQAASSRLRPILMTSIAFMLGVLPLALATGAGANARKSIGITVFSGMLASTCLAVLFVPSFFVVIQRLEEWMTARKVKSQPAPPPPASVPAQ
jgi:HAE1 family hydrophobic/amphiphilic exporter-1